MKWVISDSKENIHKYIQPCTDIYDIIPGENKTLKYHKQIRHGHSPRKIIFSGKIYLY